MKKIILALIALTLILSLAACGGSKIKDDVAVSALAEKVGEKVSNLPNMMAAEDNYLQNLMLLEAGVSAEHVVMVNTAGKIAAEFGIFKGSDKANTEKIAKEVENYLARLDSEMAAMYIPEELPKLRGAEVKIVGNYVIYAVLDEAEKAEVFKVFEAELGA